MGEISVPVQKVMPSGSSAIKNATCGCRPLSGCPPVTAAAGDPGTSAAASTAHNPTNALRRRRHVAVSRPAKAVADPSHSSVADPSHSCRLPELGPICSAGLGHRPHPKIPPGDFPRRGWSGRERHDFGSTGSPTPAIALGVGSVLTKSAAGRARCHTKSTHQPRRLSTTNGNLVTHRSRYREPSDPGSAKTRWGSRLERPRRRWVAAMVAPLVLAGAGTAVADGPTGAVRPECHATRASA